MFRVIKPVLLSLLFGLLGASVLHAEAPEGKLRAYRAARIVTVAGDPVAPGLLLVRGDKIEDVVAATEDPPEGAELVDLGLRECRSD